RLNVPSRARRRLPNGRRPRSRLISARFIVVVAIASSHRTRNQSTTTGAGFARMSSEITFVSRIIISVKLGRLARRHRRVRLKVDPALGAEELQGKIGQIARGFAVKGVAQDAARFFLHRAPMFGGADSQPRFQTVFEAPYRDACHQIISVHLMRSYGDSDSILPP